MRELAACLSLSAGSLYHRYPNKQHLPFDLIEYFYEELLAALSVLSERGQAILGPFGVMGGYMQPQGNERIVMNLVNFDLPPGGPGRAALAMAGRDEGRH
ncbi:hypothetical protein EDB98_107222 [Pseudomonas fluorescens]|nr:hypothetical protein EDB98_107222 [Pseudomonas fluorescens]